VAAETARLRHGPVVPRVGSALRAMLTEGRWRPGERLPNEVALAAELGVGRSSVREAVRLLAHDGLVEVRHGSGTYAARPPAPAGEGDMRRLLRRDHPELATVLVTHHLEELPASTTHAMLLRTGECLVSGAVDEVVTTVLRLVGV